jgi:hypothetical protein
VLVEGVLFIPWKQDFANPDRLVGCSIPAGGDRLVFGELDLATYGEDIFGGMTAKFSPDVGKKLIWCVLCCKVCYFMIESWNLS